jgi:selenide,water dikinase
VHARLPLLFDPQTSGGLVFGLSHEHAALALERLRAAGDDAATIIGSVAPARSDGSPTEVRLEECRSSPELEGPVREPTAPPGVSG